MLGILNEYRNPIVGILALLFMVVFIFFLDSLKRKRAYNRKQNLLNNLGKQFDSIDLHNNIKQFLAHAKNATQTLIIIAQTYVKAGDYEQAIAIYKTLSEKPLESHEKLEVLELLGDAYYKAGFLERSKTIFLEILHFYPHNTHILEYYMRTCENLKHFGDALQALESLEELGYAEIDSTSSISLRMQKLQHTKNYLKAMQICHEHRMPLLEQQERLLAFYEEDITLRAVILRYFRLYHVSLFWEKILEIPNVMPYIDVLWHFQKHEVPLEFVMQHEELRAIYCAKGFIDGYQESNDFTLEIMQLLQKHSHIRANITFSYTCRACKNKTPFFSYRCPFCAEIGIIDTIALATPLIPPPPH